MSHHRLYDRTGLAALLGALAGSAEAQEYCVACTEPSALYRCVIEGAQPGGGQSLQMLCVTAMAKEGRHATCRIKRGHRVRMRRPGEARALGRVQTRRSRRRARSYRPPRKPGARSEEPPRTVVEMAKRANEKTAEQMKKANDNVKESVESTGDAIGNATKKTWDCLRSLFRASASALSAAPATRARGAGPRRSRRATSRGRSPCGSAWLPRCRDRSQIEPLVRAHQVERHVAPGACISPSSNNASGVPPAPRFRSSRIKSFPCVP